MKKTRSNWRKNKTAIKSDVVNIYRESPYTDYFESLLENNNTKILEKIMKKKFFIFFLKNLFEIIKKQLHIFPFWSGLLFNQYNLKSNRLSNNIVERWFGYFKNKILGSYSFKIGKKQSGDYYKPGFSIIKNESEDVIQMINNLKIKDLEHLNSCK